jgi:hypothetical protein
MRTLLARLGAVIVTTTLVLAAGQGVALAGVVLTGAD